MPSTSVTLSDLREMRDAAIPVPLAARALTLDPRTVSHGIAAGTIPAIKIGKRTLVLREPLIRLLETGSARPAA